MTLTERQPLSRTRIAEAALVFIDEHGLDALSMRKLGATLGVEAMSLYNHVANKADLLAAVSDALYAEVLAALGHPEGDWKVHARALSHAYVQVANDHPSAVGLPIEPPVDSVEGREFDARIVAAAGLMTDDLRIGALLATVSNWVLGTIVQEHGLIHRRGDDDAFGCPALDSLSDAARQFREVADQLTATERFEEGLETVLAGLEARYFDR
ncbi:MAG: TetR family transcriptional regulator [Acidimicrobiales bacterium]